MKSWAFAVSPYGLALDGARSWELTPREYDALVDVYEDRQQADLKLWAYNRADFYNANFRGPDQVAFTPEDFIGEGNREARQREHVLGKMGAQVANTNLMKIKRGQPTPDVPAWAID